MELKACKLRNKLERIYHMITNNSDIDSEDIKVHDDCVTVYNSESGMYIAMYNISDTFTFLGW